MLIWPVVRVCCRCCLPPHLSFAEDIHQHRYVLCRQVPQGPDVPSTNDGNQVQIILLSEKGRHSERVQSSDLVIIIIIIIMNLFKGAYQNIAIRQHVLSDKKTKQNINTNFVYDDCAPGKGLIHINDKQIIIYYKALPP